MGQVIAVCGMPGSGKGEFSAILSAANIPVVSMGDMVRAEVKRRGLEESPNIFGEVASSLRHEFGEDVLATRLCDAVDELLRTHPLVLIEGMRGTAEHLVFANRWGSAFHTVALVADEEVRFQRTIRRGRSEDGDRTAFDLRNRREMGWGLEQLIASADVVFVNEDDLASFQQRCGKWLSSLLTG